MIPLTRLPQADTSSPLEILQKRIPPTPAPRPLHMVRSRPKAEIVGMVEIGWRSPSRPDLGITFTLDRSSLGDGGPCVSLDERGLRGCMGGFGLMSVGCRCIKHVLATRHDAFGKGELATSRLTDLFGQSLLTPSSVSYILTPLPYIQAMGKLTTPSVQPYTFAHRPTSLW